MTARIQAPTKRAIPRPFVFHWGKGEVVEEASIRCSINHHSWEPTIQLLRYDDATETLRFCVFHGKRFTRMPVLISPVQLSALMKAASKQKRIRNFLKKSLRNL